MGLSARNGRACPMATEHGEAFRPLPPTSRATPFHRRTFPRWRRSIRKASHPSAAAPGLARPPATSAKSSPYPLTPPHPPHPYPLITFPTLLTPHNPPTTTYLSPSFFLFFFFCFCFFVRAFFLSGT